MPLFTALFHLWLLLLCSIKSTPSQWNSFKFSHSDTPLIGILGKLWCLVLLNHRKVGRGYSAMENRYGLIRQGSGVWRALRDGDFEEDDVWEVLKDRNNTCKNMANGSKNSHVSVLRHLPTASRMIPKPSSHNYGSGSSNTTNHEAKFLQQSAPVNIPDWSKAYGQKPNKASKNASWRKYERDGDGDEGGDDGGRDSGDDYEVVVEEEEEGEEEYNSKVPPHEFIARRLARSQISSFSVFEGAGRTLKGRDLSKVRNAILIKTGFLESL